MCKAQVAWHSRAEERHSWQRTMVMSTICCWCNRAFELKQFTRNGAAEASLTSVSASILTLVLTTSGNIFCYDYLFLMIPQMAYRCTLSLICATAVILYLVNYHALYITLPSIFEFMCLRSAIRMSIYSLIVVVSCTNKRPPHVHYLQVIAIHNFIQQIY